jgi:hypothetical protein
MRAVAPTAFWSNQSRSHTVSLVQTTNYKEKAISSVPSDPRRGKDSENEYLKILSLMEQRHNIWTQIAGQDDLGTVQAAHVGGEVR